MTQPSFPKEPLHEAMLYSPLPNKQVRCFLCARTCVIPDGSLGFCQVRKNENGRLYALAYGKACSVAVDPITKKPLAHFHPGASVLSIATGGCNFRCQFCDNWMISQEKIGGTDLPPNDVVRATRDNNCQGISYTYTEPTIFFEYAYDTAKLAHQVSFFNTFVTNGYMTREAIHTIAPYLDAATVDFKGGADPEFYKKFSAVPSVEPIFASLLEMKRHDIHVEITNLVIPKMGDSLERIKELATWIREKMGKDTVFHLLRFHPEYKMTDLTSTPIQTLEKACTMSREVGLNYVYIGNVPGHPYENTYCPKCHEMVIKRLSFEIVRWNLTKDMRCPACGNSIPIKGPFEPTGAAYPHSIV
jgi:pyruvate formate lyase activating enzyme